MAVRFFVPGTDADRTEDMYNWIVSYVHEMTDLVVEPVRIFAITYIHDGQLYSVKVGEIDPRTKQLVLAILRSDAYLICTPYYGVRRGEPISVARTNVTDVIYFEGLDKAYETLERAVKLLDEPGDGSLVSRIERARPLLETLTLDDIPATLAGDFISVTHKLTWRENFSGPPQQMSEDEAQDAAYAVKNLYVEVLRLKVRVETE